MPLFESYRKDYLFGFSPETIKKFSKYKNIVVIGMGGSILGTKSIYSFFKEKIKKKVFFFDNLDANLHLQFNKIKNLKNSCYIIVSKSGNTLETIKNFDVVFSQAVMVCIPPPTFNRTIEQILRVTKKTIIFNEYHKDGAVDGFFDQGRWVYDYRSIIKKYYPDAVICINNTDFKGGSWDIYGKLITITLT